MCDIEQFKAQKCRTFKYSIKDISSKGKAMVLVKNIIFLKLVFNTTYILLENRKCDLNFSFDISAILSNNKHQ